MPSKRLALFWSALSLAVAAAAATHAAALLFPAADVRPTWWSETLRPFCVATSLLALTLGVVLTYSDPAEPEPVRAYASRIPQGRALWAAATVALMLLMARPE